MPQGPLDRLKRLMGARRRVSHSADTDDLDVVKRLIGKTLSFQVRHAGSVLRLEEAE